MFPDHPALSDSEEIIGKFLGQHGDQEIWSDFSRHWYRLFPKIPHFYLIKEVKFVPTCFLKHQVQFLVSWANISI